ncbi:MAG: hypothetical protein ACRDRN_22845 [Sciscionella sp.]
MSSGSGFEGSGELHQVVAALRADRADVESYTRVLSNTLGDALPAGMVEVERRRTFADRVAGREGQPISVRVNTSDRQLALSAGKHGGVTAEIRQVVRDVAISRKEVGIDEWLVAFAEELTKLAARDTRARDALTRLLNN